MPTTVRPNSTLLLTLAALSALSLSAVAQAPDNSDTPGGGSPAYMQPQAAPIERSQPANQTVDQSPDQQQIQHAPPPSQYRPPMVKTSQPAQGIYLSVSPHGNVTTVAATADHTELRVDSGIANIAVHHAAKDTMILVDLGGGQINLLKDGFYTFNANTKTARVLVGEAEVANTNSKPIKVKEDHSITFGTGEVRSVGFEPFQARADVLPRDNAYNHGDGSYYPAYGYGYGYPYFYPYYAWGYPYYGWGYPYGFGLGFGYYGGFYGRGFYGRR